MGGPFTTSKFAGKCKQCGSTWKAGQRIELIAETQKWCINPNCPATPPAESAESEQQAEQQDQPVPQTHTDLFDVALAISGKSLAAARKDAENYYRGRQVAPNVIDILTSVIYKELMAYMSRRGK